MLRKLRLGDDDFFAWLNNTAVLPISKRESGKGQDSEGRGHVEGLSSEGFGSKMGLERHLLNAQSLQKRACAAARAMFAPRSLRRSTSAPGRRKSPRLGKSETTPALGQQLSGCAKEALPAPASQPPLRRENTVPCSVPTPLLSPHASPRVLVPVVWGPVVRRSVVVAPPRPAPTLLTSKPMMPYRVLHCKAEGRFGRVAAARWCHPSQ